MKSNTLCVTSPLLPGQVFYVDGKLPLSAADNKPKLKKDGTIKRTHSNKKKGVSSETFEFTIEDAHRISDYLLSNEKWLHYLIFTLQTNTARRIGDIMRLCWKDIFNPNSGKFRENITTFAEEKTGKFAAPFINDTIKETVIMYLDKIGYDPATDNYEQEIVWQHTGNYRGRPMTYNAFYNCLKNAMKNLGIEYNIGTHSCRKFCGSVLEATHGGDTKRMSIISSMLNHSSEQITRRYIGLQKKDENRYYVDYGEFHKRYVVDGETFEGAENLPIINIDINDLRNIIKNAYLAGAANSDITDAGVHIDAINAIMKEVEKSQR